MSKKHFYLTLILLCCIFRPLCASSFTFSTPDVFSLKISPSKVQLKLKSALFEADSTRFTVKTAYGSFYVRYAGGGGAVFDYTTMRLGFDFTAREPEDPLEEGWTYSVRSATDRHLRFDVLFRLERLTERLELECNVHIDRNFGIYADSRTLAEIRRNGIRFRAERKLSNVRKTELRLEFGNLFGAKLRINTGEAPVYGQTSRKHQTDYEVWFKIESMVFRSVNVYKIKGDTGTENYTEFSVKLESSVLDMGVSSRLARTEGSTYAFSQPSVSLVLKLTCETDFGTLGLQIHEDRSVKITLQSEVSHVGAGKLRFTGDIDP